MSNHLPDTDISLQLAEMNNKLDRILSGKAHLVNPKILTLDDSAKYLSISKSKLKNLIKDQLIDLPSKIGGNYFYEICYLDDYIFKHRSVSRVEMTEAISKTILGLNKRKRIFPK